MMVGSTFYGHVLYAKEKKKHNKWLERKAMVQQASPTEQKKEG